MPELTAYENENAFFDFTLKYGQLYSTTASRGNPVAQADTSDVFFYASATESGTPWLTLKQSTGGIEWLSATTGKIRVKLNSNTSGHSGSGQYFELRIKFSDSSYVTAHSGTLNIVE